MIYIGSDHAGYPLKIIVADYLKSENITFYDAGTYGGEKGHYPVYAETVARALQQGKCDRGILCCGSGEGMNIVANKFLGIRSARCNTVKEAVLSREHNNVNILTMGANFVEKVTAYQILDTWLNTDFMGGRHKLKLALIDRIEQEGTCLPYGQYN
jgi:ribose 5-phosphate isomerase B